MMRDLLGQSWSALRHNRRRATLTMLGMAWGIATVVILLAYGAGFERAIMYFFNSFGANMIAIFPGRTSLQAGGTKAGTQVRFTLDDIDYITNENTLVKRISPMAYMDSVTVAHDTRSVQWGITSCYPAYQQIRVVNAAEGRLLNEEDQFGHARVAVINDKARKKLFSGQPAVGETITIKGISFQVIGVLERKISEDDDNADRVIIPFSTMGDLRDTRYLDGIFMQYEGPNSERVAKSLREVMGAHHSFKPEDKRAIYMWNMMEDINTFAIVSTGIKILMAFIGTLTLGIGGVGLMNIMLVSVTQRTREIGVEKALGARRRDILFQFLAEALAITFAGGILGIILAYAVTLVAGTLTLMGAFIENAGEGDIHLRIDPTTLIVATVILTAVGIVSGMLPAIKASRLSPIEALRYE